MTEKSFNSFTLSFDHFAPIEEYNHGYVALYKRANESQWQTEKGKRNYLTKLFTFSDFSCLVLFFGPSKLFWKGTNCYGHVQTVLVGFESFWSVAN